MTSKPLESFSLMGGGGYTGVQTMDNFKNCIAMGLLDESGSTRVFARPMELCVQEIVRSLRHCKDVADMLYYRHCHFDTNFREIHGWKKLMDCNETDYDGIWAGGGRTTLYDSCCRSILELLDYAERQGRQKFIVNGILYVITDGCDFGSAKSQDDVKESLAKAVSSEYLESLITILIGVNSDPTVQQGLRDFANNVGFTQYEKVEDANEKNLARIANFVSKSIHSQSQHVGTGAPSQSLKF